MNFRYLNKSVLVRVSRTCNFRTPHIMETTKSCHWIRRIPFHSITILHVRKDHFTVILRFILISVKSGGYLSSVFGQHIVIFFLCFVDRASRYNRVKKNQLDAQLILSIFRQPLHVTGVSMPIIRRYKRMYTTIGTCYSC